jgi:hypothetical protein
VSDDGYKEENRKDTKLLAKQFDKSEYIQKYAFEFKKNRGVVP